MRRAGLVAAVTTVLALGAAGQGWATAFVNDITATWGDRTRIRVTWVDRNSFRHEAFSVTDRTCDDRSVYAALTIRTGSGALLTLGPKRNTGGCGTTADFRDVRAADPSGIRSLTMALCHQAADTTAADHCETQYISLNPYYGF
ncbi:hypothetical protein [Streptomyces roseolilacinus]|uniref:hypothetical protein n=1 Tax=Streptomyces roseolilacinus TaxID=66904 RepID=UPI0038001E6F